jgi:hypothetical protein
MKKILLLGLLLATTTAFACTDPDADALVLDRVKMMAKRYSAKKVGVGASILWGDTRVTSISIMDGIGDATGRRVDRMGTIFINMDTCVVKAKLIGLFDTFDLK